MCGIAGFFGAKRIDRGAIEKTMTLMRNRGPDSQSFEEMETDSGVALFIHSRLSIIDLDERANQPFKRDGCTLVYNGEIYNYLEIKKELEAAGLGFRTESDTEVLAAAYKHWGEECNQRFEGMWAYALWDQNRQQLILSRDRFGEKPLYYMETKEGLYFGSEIKFIQALSGIKPSINLAQVKRYLVNGYKALYKGSDTFFEGIKELPRASYMEIPAQGAREISTYWKPGLNIQPMSEQEAVEGFRHHLLESVRLRLRADVPLAFCLSGGVDSSSLTSIAGKCFNYDVATFSIIDSDERYDESENIMATVNDLGCKHTLIHLKHGDFLERLQRQVAYHDGPICTISYFVHSMISEAIAEHGYRVAISGTGADELVTGYYDHFIQHLYEVRNHPEYQKYLDNWYRYTGRFVRNDYLKNPELYFNQPGFRDHMYLEADIFAGYLVDGFNEAFSEDVYCDSLLRNRMMNEMFHEAVPPILHEDDLNSMYYSIENRSPYLDTRLFEFAYTIPNEHLISNGYGKYILREAMKGILNERVRCDRQKKGFNASINTLIDFDDPESRAYLLDDSPIFELVRKDKIVAQMEINPMPNSLSKFMFNFICAKMFFEMA